MTFLQISATVIPCVREVLPDEHEGNEQGPGHGAKSIRDYLGLKAGSAVMFEHRPDGEIVLRPRSSCGRASGRRGARPVRLRLRGRATVRMNTDEIMALTRGA